MAKEKMEIKTANNAGGKSEAIDAALAQIEKTFGEGSIMRLGNAPMKQIEVISTGALSLDIALGVGGVPRGRITEIYGPESSGKTTVALHIIAEAQKNGGEAAFIDAEHALDPDYAQALEIAEALARSGAVDVIIVDSVAALVPKAEIAGTMGDSHVGLHARLMSQALRKLTSILNKTNTAAIFINQLREKVGVMFGNPEVTTGGRALKFYSTVRIDVRRIESIKDASGIIGNRTRAKVVKNKVAPPFKEAEFDIMFGEGISKEGNVIDIGVLYDVVQKGGSWYSYNGDRIGQGRDRVKEFLKEHPEITEEIYNKIMDKVKEEKQEKERLAAERAARINERLHPTESAEE